MSDGVKGLAVGVDAGGTSTVAAAGDAMVIARGGPANASVVGVAAAAAEIARVARAAAGDGARVAALYVGAAGAGRPRVALALRDALREQFPGAAVAVEHDARIALRAAVPDGPAAVVIAGTGSVAYAQFGERSALAGGDGPLLGDAGSGYDVGLQAVRSLARALDGRGDDGPLAVAVRDALGVRDRGALLDALYGDARLGPNDIAALAPAVFALARGGDASAAAIVLAACAALAELLVAAVARAGGGEPPGAVVLAGGLFADGAFAGAVTSLVAARYATARVVRAPNNGAAEGAALRFARELAEGRR